MKTELLKKLIAQNMFFKLITGIGILLLIFMITVEDEPGAIPLLLITAGLGGYFFTRSRIRAQNR